LAQSAERLARQVRLFQKRAERGNHAIDFATEIASIEALGTRLRRSAASFDSRKSTLRRGLLQMLLIYVQEKTDRACTNELSEILGVTTSGTVTEMTLKKLRSKAQGSSAAGPDWHGVMTPLGRGGRQKTRQVSAQRAGQATTTR
jgi:hypothetical protein